MKKRLAVAASALMFVGLGAGVVAAAPDNANNDHGICTAYFNGQKKGHTEGSSPGPFGALEDANDDDLASIFDSCGGPAGIGGNGDQNGRFTTCWVDDDGDSDTHPCDD